MLLTKTLLGGNRTVEISGSKSISNRLLILEKLLEPLQFENLSTSEDTEVLQHALNSQEDTIDVKHAGTAMRFLTAYFALQEGRSVTLTGSARMKQRPVKPLVEGLRSLGAEIEYLENQGFPPLKIKGKKLRGGQVTLPASVSSQFITALILIGAKMEEGLTIVLEGKITSRPYLEMTLKILRTLDIPNAWEGNVITVSPPLPSRKNYHNKYVIESDWSSASYFYSLAALSGEAINLRYFRPYSLQGDHVVKEIYWKYFGVNTISEGAESKISLLKEMAFNQPKVIHLDMNDCPDIAQTVCVTAAAMKIPFHITGLETLKIKETDRLAALQTELLKLGCQTEITEDSIFSRAYFEPETNIRIRTYDDHRMAMSFAPYCVIADIFIENPEVVAKSYSNFWEDLRSLCHSIS